MSDTMRAAYRQLSEAEHSQIADIKGMGEVFLRAVDTLQKPGRETSLAKTKIEEAVMWAVKGITG